MVQLHHRNSGTFLHIVWLPLFFEVSSPRYWKIHKKNLLNIFIYLMEFIMPCSFALLFYFILLHIYMYISPLHRQSKLHNPSPDLPYLALPLPWAQGFALTCFSSHHLIIISLLKSAIYSGSYTTVQMIHWNGCPTLSDHQCSFQSDYYLHGRVVWS